MNECIIVGIRPQFIHLFGLFRDKVLPEEVTIINTGQHFSQNMSQIFLEELELPATANLGMKSKEDGEYKLTRFIKELDPQPSKIYVIGDSTTTTIGAMVAKAFRLPLVHIEAGLRCNELIPEEVNRRFVDAISDELWAPTSYAEANLLKEGVSGEVKLTANFRLSSFLEAIQKVEPKTYDVVCEFHRQNNVDDIARFKRIIYALTNSNRKVFWSVHPRISSNPACRTYLLKPMGNVTISKPLGYLEWLSYLKGADTVITDSGGVQLEAYELGKEIITLRSDVEWKHTLDRSKLIGDNLEQLEEILS